VAYPFGMIGRRGIIGAGLGLAGGLTAASLASAVAPLPLERAQSPSGSTRRLAFHNLHTGEALDVTYMEDGVLVPDALAAIQHQLRDYRTGDEHVISPRLLAVLNLLNAKLETQAPFGVISGYRSPRTNAMLARRSGEVNPNSLHMQGMAIDIRVPGRDSLYVRKAAMGLSAGGVGYYPVSDFVHVDVGDVKSWEGT